MPCNSKNNGPAAAGEDDLRQAVIAGLAAARHAEPEGGLLAPIQATAAFHLDEGAAADRTSSKPTGKRRGSDTARSHRVSECVRTIVAAAAADAAALGRHLDHLVEHFSTIGCTGRSEIADYFRLANRTLASLYHEAAKARPSPSELTRLALRYALDARRPVEGDVGRFELKCLENAWEVIEYPSIAMRLPSIPLPGRVVRDIFAVGILGFLRQEPPAIYSLMALIERLLGGIPAETDGLTDKDKRPTRNMPELKVDLDKSIVSLDGEPFPVTPEQAHFVHLVASARGNWISSTEIGEAGDVGLMVGPRPDRVRMKLPSPVRDLIEARAGRGFRLRLA